MKRLAAAFIVTWKVTGYSLNNCDDQKAQNTVTGMCIQPINMTRTATFDAKASAMAVVKGLKDDKSEAYKVSEVHVYSEEGAK